MSNTTTTANGTARRGKLGQRVAYACGNLGQSAFYNALSTYFVVYVTSSLFAGVDKGVATKLIGVITGLVVVIRIAEIFIDPLLGNIIDNTTTMITTRQIPPASSTCSACPSRSAQS